MTLKPLFVACLLCLAGGAASSQEIGAVASSVPAMEGTPPGAAQRVLAVGGRVVSNERINTSDSGSGQVLFLDQTTLTVASNSDIVLDRYIYDPERDAGEMAATLTKGVFRFIGGKITKKTEATITTPVATIGIRGGIALIEACAASPLHCEDGVMVIHVAGEHTRITGKGGTLFLSRPSAMVRVMPDGVPVFEGLADSGDFARLQVLLEGRGNGARWPSKDAAQGGRFAEAIRTISGEKGAPWQGPVSTSGEELPEREPLFELLRGDDPLSIFSDDFKLMEPVEAGRVLEDTAIDTGEEQTIDTAQSTTLP